jgi:uncharacterized membrane protein
MAFCPNCGSQATGTFCANCGTPLSEAAASGGSTGAGYTATTPGVQASGLTANVASALCYLLGLITGIIFLLIAPYNQNKTVRFHAFQAIFAHLGIIALAILLGILSVLTHGLGFLLFPLFWCAVFVLWLYMMYTAYNNRTVKLPVVGDLAAKQA